MSTFVICLSSTNSGPSSCSKMSKVSRVFTLFFQFLSAAESRKTGRMDWTNVEPGNTYSDGSLPESVR